MEDIAGWTHLFTWRTRPIICATRSLVRKQTITLQWKELILITFRFRANHTQENILLINWLLWNTDFFWRAPSTIVRFCADDIVWNSLFDYRYFTDNSCIKPKFSQYLLLMRHCKRCYFFNDEYAVSILKIYLFVNFIYCYLFWEIYWLTWKSIRNEYYYLCVFWFEM